MFVRSDRLHSNTNFTVSLERRWKFFSAPGKSLQRLGAPIRTRLEGVELLPGLNYEGLTIRVAQLPLKMVQSLCGSGVTHVYQSAGRRPECSHIPLVLGEHNNRVDVSFVIDDCQNAKCAPYNHHVCRIDQANCEFSKRLNIQLDEAVLMRLYQHVSNFDPDAVPRDNCPWYIRVRVFSFVLQIVQEWKNFSLIGHLLYSVQGFNNAVYILRLQLFY